MPRKTRGELILSAIEFPLPSEIGITGPGYQWPAPVSHIAGCAPERPADDVKWSMRIQQLIQATRTGQVPSRADAALRLYHLDKASLLSPAELASYGKALWAQMDRQKNLPLGTNLLPHVFLDIPSQDHPNAAVRYFTDYLFKAPARDLLRGDALLAIIGAAIPTKRREALRPIREDALRLFDAILALKPVEGIHADLIDMGARTHLARQIGPALAIAIMPVLEAADFNNERVEKLFQLIHTELVPSAIVALPLLVRMHPQCEQRTVKTIRRAIVGRNSGEVSAAVGAIDNWLSSPQELQSSLA